MVHHAAFRQELPQLDIAILDQNHAMGLVLTSMVEGLGARSIRRLERSGQALKNLREQPPHLILIDWRYGPQGACDVISKIRSRSMWPVCFAPILVMTKRATRATVAQSLNAGAQSVVLKPFSSSALYRKLQWVLEDDRPLELKHDRYVVDGMESFGAMSTAQPRSLEGMSEPIFPNPRPDHGAAPSNVVFSVQAFSQSVNSLLTF